MECLHRSWMGHSSRDMEVIDAEGELNCGGRAQDFSEENNVSMRSRDWFF